jgi:large subunit ribosomal protein L25
MQAVSLKATEREILGKKVKRLRKEGIIPAHVYGKGTETEHVSVKLQDFLKVFATTGESGLIDLKIGEEKTRPVLVRGVQYDVIYQIPLHIDFYQVNLKEKVTVPVPIIMEGEEPELVHTGEALVIQTLNEVEVEALPTELPENIIVNISSLKVIGDAIQVSSLQVAEGVTIIADPETVVVKLDNAITEEMQKLMEEQAAEQAAVAAEAAAVEGAEGGEAATEGDETPEGETGVGEKEAETESPEDRQDRQEEPAT